MRQQRSFFNPILARNFFRRFWPLSLAVLLTVLLYPGTGILGIPAETHLTHADKVLMAKSAVYGTATVMLILMTCAAFLDAALVFHHLHDRKETQFYGALPVSRRGMYLTAWGTGYLLIALPMVLGLLIDMLIALGCGLGGAVPALGHLILAALGCELFLFAIAALACILAGHTFGALLIYAGMHVAVYIISLGVFFVASLLMPGIQVDASGSAVVRWLTPVMNLAFGLMSRHMETEPYAIIGFDSPLILGICALLGLGLGGLGLWLYQIRPGENAGETVAFPPLRVVCKVFGALIVCSAGSLLLLETGLFRENIPFPGVVLIVLLTAALGWFIGEMVVRKSLKVFDKKALVPCGILLAVLLVLTCGTKLDLLHRVRYIPAQDQVEKAELIFNYQNTVTLDPADAAALHGKVLEMQDQCTNNDYEQNSRLELIYTLKNGRQLFRTYLVRWDLDQQGAYIRDNPLIQEVRTLLTKPDYNYQTWFGSDSPITPDTLREVSYEQYDYDPETGEYLEDFHLFAAYNGAEAYDLYQAVLRDMEAGHVTPQGFDQAGIYGTLSMTWYEEPYDAARYSSFQLYQERVGLRDVYMEVTAEMTETLSWLRDHGVDYSR